MMIGMQKSQNYVNLLSLCANALCVIARRHRACHERSEVEAIQ